MDKLDIDKMETTPTDLSKLSNAVINEVVGKTIIMNWLKKVNAIQNIDTNDLVKNTDYNIKIGDIEKKIPDHDKYITIQ